MKRLIDYLRETMILDFQGDVAVERLREQLPRHQSAPARAEPGNTPPPSIPLLLLLAGMASALMLPGPAHAGTQAYATAPNTEEVYDCVKRLERRFAVLPTARAGIVGTFDVASGRFEGKAHDHARRARPQPPVSRIVPRLQIDGVHADPRLPPRQPHRTPVTLTVGDQVRTVTAGPPRLCQRRASARGGLDVRAATGPSATASLWRARRWLARERS